MLKCLFWLWWLLPPAAPGPALYLKRLPGHPDQACITYYEDSLRRRAVHPPFLTLLTRIHGQNVTYFIWLRGNLFNAIRLTDSTVSRSLTNQPQHFAVLLNPGKLAILQAEDRLKFKPPVNPGATDILFVETSPQPYLVEYGSGAGYVLDPARDANRRYFFQVLRQDLSRLDANWQPAGRYLRRY